MPKLPTSDVLVVGAGVSGLSTAVRLAEAGLSVRVIAESLPALSTSAKAGASWGPYMTDDPRVVPWGWVTYAEFKRLAGESPAHGIRFLLGMEASERIVEPEPWARSLPDFRLCGAGELPPRFRTGWWQTLPVVDMPRYLAYLVDRLAQAGPQIEIEPVRSLADLADRAGVVVNCTGLGARDLVDDPSLTAVRGQLVVVKNPGIDWFFQDDAEEGDLTYFLPHGDEVILGGSALKHADDIQPDPGIRDAIIERCAAVEPLLGDPVILRQRVGFRPKRPQIRVEVEYREGRPVVHNYGHGGSGVTVSWGCAADALDLVTAELGRS